MFNALSTGVTGFIGAGVKAAKDTIPTIPNPIGGGEKDEDDEMNALEAAANAKNPRPPPRSNEGDEEDDRTSVASSGATSGADSPVSGNLPIYNESPSQYVNLWGPSPWPLRNRVM